MVITATFRFFNSFGCNLRHVNRTELKFIKILHIPATLIIFTLLLPTFCLSAETVQFGINVPLTGAYSKQGEDQLRAYRLAINILNQRGGILGKKIVYSVRDTKTEEETARNNAIDLIRDGAIMITGGASSASAIAQAEICQQNNIVFMAGLTHSNSTTGENGHRHTFRWFNNGHQTAKALAQLLVDRFGQNAKYAFIYADYTWGQTVQSSLQRVIEDNGGTTVLNIPTKLGTKSYISFLLKAKRANPDVLVLVHFGKDMISCLKQTTQLQLREKMAIVVPLMELHMAHPLGPEVMQGVITSMPWYHGLSKKYQGSREFVGLFEHHYNKKPGSSAAVAWINIFQYAEAVERAGSFNHKTVIKALEGHHFQLLGGEEYWRSWDHQGIHPTYIAIGKTPEKSQGEWDLFHILAEKEGKGLARTRAENPITLEPLH